MPSGPWGTDFSNLIDAQTRLNPGRKPADQQPRGANGWNNRVALHLAIAGPFAAAGAITSR